MTRISAPRTAALAAALSAAAAAGSVAAARRRPAVTDRLTALTDRRRLAVVPLTGVIGGTLKAAPTARRLEELARDRTVRGVLLDIDSPGGSAIESEALYVAVRRLAAHVPVVAWVRGTGASGSYFLACGATRILAFPGAVVGSIGVISARPVLAEVLRRIGVEMNVTTTGPWKDLGAPWRTPTDADRAKERELVDAVFRRFTDAVASARHLEGEALAAVTTGEVWLGEQALAIGLVDGLADEEEALAALQELAGLPRRRLRRVEPRRSMARRLGLPGAALLGDPAALLAELEGHLGAPRVTL